MLGIAAYAGYQAINVPKGQIAGTQDAATIQYSAPNDPVRIVDNSPKPSENIAPVAASQALAAPVLETSTSPTNTPVDVLEQRLLATGQWLDQQNGEHYSIQLLGADNPELLREYFKTIAKYV